MFSIKAGIDISFSIAVILLKYSTYISYLYLLVGMGWDLTVLIPIALNCIINMKPLYGSWHYKSNQIKSNQIKSNFICTAHFIQGGNTMRLTVGKKRGGVTTLVKNTQIF